MNVQVRICAGGVRSNAHSYRNWGEGSATTPPTRRLGTMRLRGAWCGTIRTP